MERIEIVTQLVAAALTRGHVELSEDVITQVGVVAGWIIAEDEKHRFPNGRPKQTGRMP